jgi:hypothetical protein
MFDIIGTYHGTSEVLDTVETQQEAEYLRREYQMAYGREWLVTTRRSREPREISQPYRENAGARLRFPVHSYHDAVAFLEHRYERKLANNTILRKLSNGDIAVVLHNTEIVVFHQDGTLTLRTGGYRTVTTKARINTIILPLGFRVAQHKFEWTLWNWQTHEEEPFFEGIRISTTAPDIYPSLRKNPRHRVTGRRLRIPAATGPADAFFTEVWEERDRLHIALYYDPKHAGWSKMQQRMQGDGQLVAEWWDNDAREMFEDGFFKSGRDLDRSVIQYANDMGLIRLK